MYNLHAHKRKKYEIYVIQRLVMLKHKYFVRFSFYVSVKYVTLLLLNFLIYWYFYDTLQLIFYETKPNPLFKHGVIYFNDIILMS